jgi:TPP-dependent pyruvate/acetoin dehydrogenase alpha subunit
MQEYHLITEDRQLPSIFSALSRAIRGTHPSNITKYTEYLNGYLEERDIYRKAKEQKYWYEKDRLEKLDREITKGMLEEEEQCRVYHRQPWTKEVNEVMTTANILRIHLSSMKNNINCNKRISQKQTMLKKEIRLPTDIKEASIALSLAQKNCRRIVEN